MPAPLAPGTFLIASLNLEPDPHFTRTVVLILSYHPDEGARGVVINRPMGEKLKMYPGEELQQLSEGLEQAQTISGGLFFEGGPMALSSLIFLHRLEHLGEGRSIFQDLYASGDLEAVRTHAAVMDPRQPVLRFYLGHSGWSPGQLEDEVAKGYWILSPGSVELVFSPEPESVWQQALYALGGKYRALSFIHEDAGVN